MKSRIQNTQTTSAEREQVVEIGRILFASLTRALFALLIPPVVLVARPSSPERYQYLHPLPNSSFVNPKTNVIVRYGDEIRRGDLGSQFVQVTGSLSGGHLGKLLLSDDNKTIVFRPATPFREGEIVTVDIGEGVRTLAGKPLPPVSYRFTVSPGKPVQKKALPVTERSRKDRAVPISTPRLRALSSTNTGSKISLPSTFPPLSLFANDKPAGDPLFLSNFSFDPGMTTPYLMILNRNCEPVFYRQTPPCWDFKLQPTGTLTYYDEDLGYFLAMDSSYHIIDQYYCGNGCNTNEHELRVLPNGHAYLMAYDAQMIAMDTVVEGGNPNAMVFGLIIQEIDLNKEVVFEWRSWDHFKITDALREDLTGVDIDYVHGNAIEIESDGNLLISSRNMDEVTKIDRTTGEIIWRMGGKNNQFTFVNDPDGFNAQHDIRRLDNGHVTLFDNGTYRGYSRVVEYELDESSLTATLVWEYRHDPDILGWALGSAQRLPDGNTLIGWGSANPTVSEVTPDGREVYEMGLPELIYSYRVFSHSWKTNAFVPAVESVVFPDVAVDNSSSFELVISNPTDYDITLTSLSTRTSVFTVVPQEAQFLAAHGSIRVPLLFQPKSYGSFADTLEIWSEDETQGIVQRVHLAGTSFFPTIRTDQSTLSFGDLVRGTSKQLLVKILNTSGGTLLVDSIFTTTPEFVVNRGSCSVVTEDSITVTFTPHAFGDFRDTLHLRVTSAGLQMTVALSGASPAPLLSVSSVSLNFGNVRDGDTATLGFAVRNRSVNPLTITGATVGSSVFATLLKTPALVPANDSVAAEVRFMPTSSGSYTDTLLLASDGGTAAITLRGSSSMPTLTTDPPLLLFGAVQIGTSKELIARILNGSGFTLVVDSIYTKRPEFVVDKGSCAVAAVDSVKVTFTPSTYGEIKDTLYLRNNSATPLKKVALSGASPVPVLSPSSTNLVFADVQSGDTAALTLTLRNRSINALTITAATVKGKAFAALLQTPATIPGNDSLAMEIEFSPGSPGTYTDTLVMVSDGGTTGIALRGTSSVPTLETEPAVLMFGEIQRGTAKPLTMKILNASAYTLFVDSIYTKRPEFIVNKKSCSVVAVDSLAVVFNPGTFGDFRDTLYLRNNSAVPLVKVVLTGASPAPVLSVSSAALIFASVKSGDSSTLSLTLRNRSINPLTVTGATVKGSVFSALIQTPVIIPGNDSLAAGVRFSPKAVGTFTDTLSLVSDGGIERVLLRGTGSDPAAGIERTPDAVPSAYSLSQNYPNPFNPSTTIVFGIPEASGVTLTVYDITGKQVLTLVRSQLAPGYYRCVWNAAGSASGMYLYRLTATPVDGRSTQAFTQVKKLLLLQ